MSDEIRRVNVGSVRVFAGAKPDKAQALKPLEEAAEVFGAWQWWDGVPDDAEAREGLLDECADVIQATCNLVEALGVSDMREWMRRCESRNEARGRYGREASDGQEEAGRHG